MSITTAVILAGGKGARLDKVSGGLPKPLVPVSGTPVIIRQLELLARYGVSRVFITTAFRADLLRKTLGDGSFWGLDITYVHEEEPLGTAGGLAALEHALCSDFYVLYGDVLVNMDLYRLSAAHDATRADGTIVVHPNDHPYDSDVVLCDDDGRISGWFPYPRHGDGGDLPNLVSAAFYVLSPSVFRFIQPDMRQDFVRDVFPKMGDQCRIFAYRTTEYLKDMGTPNRLERVERDLRSGRVRWMHSDCRRPTLFLDRDGVLNEEVDGVTHPDALRLIPGAAAAVASANDAGWLVAVVTNQPAIAKGFMTEKELKAVHNRLETLLGEQGAWVDGIAYCPHHPERGFPGERPALKIECNCRKPNTGLFLDVRSRLPVGLDESVMIGDHWRDVVAAKRLGIDAISVRSGYGYRDAVPANFLAVGLPDLIAEDLAAACQMLFEDCQEVDFVADEISKRFKAGSGPAVVILSGGRAPERAQLAFRLHRHLKSKGLRCRSWCLDGWINDLALEALFPPWPAIDALLSNEWVRMPVPSGVSTTQESELAAVRIRLDADILLLHGKEADALRSDRATAIESGWCIHFQRGLSRKC